MEVGGRILAVRHLSLLLVVFGPVTVVGPVLRYWDCVGVRRSLMAHRLGSRCDSPFADSCVPFGWGLAVLCPQQYMTAYNVIHKGVGFRAFLRVVEGDARGGGRVSVPAPRGAYYVGLYSVDEGLV